MIHKKVVKATDFCFGGFRSSGKFPFGQKEAFLVPGNLPFGQKEAFPASGSLPFGQKEAFPAPGNLPFGQKETFPAPGKLPNKYFEDYQSVSDCPLLRTKINSFLCVIQKILCTFAIRKKTTLYIDKLYE